MNPANDAKDWALLVLTGVVGLWCAASFFGNIY